MSKFATASLNLSKIDKTKLFTGKTGDKYLNVVIWFNDEPDQYGNDFAIQQSVSKEEREAGEKGVYLGNGKYPVKSEIPVAVNSGDEDEGDDESSDLPW